MGGTEYKSPVNLTRRGLLSAASAISVLSLTQRPGRAFAANLEVDEFLTLSQRLVGKKDLSAEIAAEMLKALTSIGQADEISGLTGEKTKTSVANHIVEYWYTGESPDPDATSVLAYTDALIWEAMDYTKPMAFCGGGVGYWEDPPQA